MKTDRVYNYSIGGITTLNEGEEFCPKCKGRGQVPLINIETKTVRYYLRCSYCLGKGKLDWVEMATGPIRRSLHA
jgi:DnaJ-class molecular chaperone